MSTEGPIQVAASVDDAHELDNGTNFGATPIYLYVIAHPSDASRRNVGMKFDSVAIANGDTIDDVDLEIYNVFNNLDLDAEILANDVDSAVDFSSDADVTTRVDSASTDNSVPWIHSDLAVGFIKSSTDDGIDARAVIQEVIDRPGWSSGNNLVVLLQGHETTNSCFARAYDGSPSQAPKLTIDFTVGGGGPTPNGSLRLLRGAGK